jgi:signal transduction histidine kinase/ActR/RegA family two-component response regulator
MADGLLVTHPSGCIVLANPALETLFGRPADLLVGTQAATALPLPGLARLLAQAAVRPGQVCTEDMSLDTRILRASASALLDGSAVITVLRDVTREKEVDRMKTEFVSTVSHELRAPLTSVLGFTKLINRTMERDVVPLIPADHSRGQRAMQRIHENLGIIVTEGERLTRLINDVLDISKMESGRVDWHDQTLDLLPVIRQAAENVHTLAAAKGLPIGLQLPESLPTLWADADRLLQVVTNLLSNAIKFTDQGEITLRARVLQAGERANGWVTPAAWPGGILVGIQDTGVGIPPEAIGHLFQRFHQVESTLGNRPKGTGLGLAICREIISHYGGSIWAESEVGVGSCFSFALPLAPLAATEEAAAVAPGTAVPAQGGRAATVLIADDEENIRRLLRQVLTEAGYGVLEAADGTAAITAARQLQPDLLILDVKMPGLSGVDVAQVFRADPALAHIPIIVLSVEEQQHRHNLSAEAYLAKPVQMELLLRTIAQLLARAAASSAPGAAP